MANTIRIKRRASGIGAGAPSGLANAELAYNEGDNILYYGYGTGGAGGTATQVIPIAGSGSYLAKTYNLSDLNNLQTARNNLASNTVTSGYFMRGNGTNVLMGNIIASDVPTLNQNTTGSAGSVTNSLTINNGGAGDSSGSTFNGSSAKTISYNSIGSPSVGGTNATGTWNISVTGNAGTVTNGVYTTGNQSINGVKTFSNRPIFSSGITTNFIQSENGTNLELNSNGNSLSLTNSDYLTINSYTDIVNNYGADGFSTFFIVKNNETNKNQLVLSSGSIVLNDNVTSSGNILISNQTASTIASFDANKNVVSLSTGTYPSLTELGYVKGVTSAVQTQLNNKIAKTSSTTIGNIPTWSVTTGDALGTGYSVETTLTGGAGALPRADAVKTYVDSAITSGFSTNDAMVFKGTLGSGGTVTALPTGTVSAGWSYRVITTGIYAGVVSEIGDLIIAVTDAAGNVNSTWTVVQTNIDGAVVGPASSTTNALAVFNGTTGKLIQNSSFVPTTVGGNLINLTNPSAITFPKINTDNTVSTESASTYRTSLGATTVGSNFFTLTNPSAISFPRINADNTITTRSSGELRTDLSINNVENTAISTWAGSTNITTLGTISTGSWSGTSIAANKGGTGQSSYAVGDILYADTTTSLAKLTSVATGNVLLAGGVTTAPLWGKVGLTTHVSGTLPVANGGTNQTSFTDGQLLIGNSTGNTLTKATLTQGSNVTITNGNGSITIASTDTNTATAADDILDGSNTGTQITYAPYATNQAASASPRFYNTSDNPSGSGRLNVSAYFYATNLYDNGSRVVTAATICTDAGNCTWDGGSF
jgi:hypothetical protein